MGTFHPQQDHKTNTPKATIFHLPSWTFCEPRLRFFDRVRERVDVRRERRGRRRVYARDVVIRARLPEEGAALRGWNRGHHSGRER